MNDINHITLQGLSCKLNKQKLLPSQDPTSTHKPKTKLNNQRKTQWRAPT